MPHHVSRYQQLLSLCLVSQRFWRKHKQGEIEDNFDFFDTEFRLELSSVGSTFASLKFVSCSSFRLSYTFKNQNVNMEVKCRRNFQSQRRNQHKK